MLTLLRDRLEFKLLAAMAVMLAATTLVALAALAPIYRYELTNERQAVSTRLGALLQITLENAMLKRDIEGLREIVNRLGGEPNIVSIAILNPDLEVRFSSNAATLGARFDSIQQLCPACGISRLQGGAASAIVKTADGALMRSVNAVANRPACLGCHGAVADHPVNGFLVVDYDARDVVSRAWRTALTLAGFGLLGSLLMLLAAWWALRRFVVRPVAALTQASRAIASGDTMARVALPVTGGKGAYHNDNVNPDEKQGDDIVKLARTFNAMAASLASTMSQLRERDVFLQGVLDAIPEGVRVIADDYSVIAANSAFCRQSGLTLTQVLERHCYASSHNRTEPCVSTLVVCPLEALRSTDKPILCTHAHGRASDGGEFAVEVVAAPLRLDGAMGGRRYVVEAIRDLSKDMEISQEQRLSEIGQLATGVAHEIYNPLASVRFGLSALRKATPPDTEASGYIDLVANEIERCIEITGRLMKLSQGAGSRGMLIDLQQIANDVASLLRYDALNRGLDLRIDIAPHTRIVAGEGEIGMVLVNLLQNAFHATPTGGAITVTGGRDDTGVLVEIADTGVGIAPDDLKNIFQPFWTRRADRSTGSGLGLAICKALVVKWRGSISVRSKVGVGSVFRLSFPNPDETVEGA